MSSLDMYRPFIRTCTFPFGVDIADEELFDCVDTDIDVFVASDIESSSLLLSLTAVDFLLTNEVKRFVVFASEFLVDDFASEEGKLT